MEIKRKLKDLEDKVNLIECPDCGGGHQCRLHYLDDNSVLITFVNGLMIEPCWGYKSMVSTEVDKFKKEYIE